jgi:hypothetical protein
MHTAKDGLNMTVSKTCGGDKLISHIPDSAIAIYLPYSAQFRHFYIATKQSWLREA